MRKTVRWMLTAVLAVLLTTVPTLALADDWYGEEPGYFTVNDENGSLLFTIATGVSVGDEYISGDNYHYTVVQVDETAKRAIARFTGELEPLQLVQRVGTAAQNTAKIALYCTHSDESYVPTDGTESKPSGGGVFDVAAELKKNLEAKGCTVELSEATHEPHDAGSYRRSRKTAVQLMESLKPDMICDIHRDAVPEKEYAEKVEGEDVSKVRMVVGRSNQNKDANQEFARKIKQVADQKYPNLVKDIYIGKGSYNQDLMPQAVLFEMGTHEIDKERVLSSTQMLADVITSSLGVTTQQAPAASPSATGNESAAPAPTGKGTKAPAGGATGSGWWKSLIWIIIGLAVIAGVVMLITVRKGQAGAKAGGFFKELTGIGKKRGPDDPRNKM